MPSKVQFQLTLCFKVWDIPGSACHMLGGAVLFGSGIRVVAIVFAMVCVLCRGMQRG